MQIFVTPNTGARVRMPERNSTVMPERGAWITRSVHYETLILNGDVIVAEPQPELPKAGDPATLTEKPAAPRASSKEK